MFFFFIFYFHLHILQLCKLFFHSFVIPNFNVLSKLASLFESCIHFYGFSHFFLWVHYCVFHEVSSPLCFLQFVFTSAMVVGLFFYFSPEIWPFIFCLLLLCGHLFLKFSCFLLNFLFVEMIALFGFLFCFNL